MPAAWAQEELFVAISAAVVPPFIAPNDLPVVGNWAGF